MIAIFRSILIAISIVGQLFFVVAKANPPAAFSSKKVEWTSVQDLNPEARAANRPIKQKWAVIIGLGKFKESRMDTETSMDKAANKFYQYAIDPNGGRFQKDHVKLLLNGESTQKNILSSLGKQWLGSLAGPDDLVVVFVSTLGFPTTDGSSYLCAYDCALDNVYGTCISIQSLMSTLKQNVKADRILLVLQACYSGNAELNSGAKSLLTNYNLDVEKVLLGKGYVILSSSKPNQMTWGDSFSNALIDSLKEQNGLIPLKDAFEKARVKTEAETSTSNSPGKKQTPVMKSAWTGKDLILGIPPVETVSNIPANVLNYLSAESHYLKANKLVAAGDLPAAKSEFELAIATDPKYENAYCDYGSLLSLQGEWQAAAGQYEKAISLCPEDSLVHSNYAQALNQLGRPDDALKELQEAYKLNPKDRTVLSALSNIYLQKQDFTQATNLLEQAVSLYPGSATLQNRLSYVMTQAGDFDAAITHAQAAIKLDPSLLSARLNLAASLMLKGDNQSALTIYKEACSSSPDNANIHYCLSKAMERTGDFRGARSELERFIQLSQLSQPEDPRVAREKSHLLELPKKQ